MSWKRAALYPRYSAKDAAEKMRQQRWRADREEVEDGSQQIVVCACGKATHPAPVHASWFTQANPN
eukprot:364446-Chlamydomonas_euryale.AAC.11